MDKTEEAAQEEEKETVGLKNYGSRTTGEIFGVISTPLAAGPLLLTLSPAPRIAETSHSLGSDDF